MFDRAAAALKPKERILAVLPSCPEVALPTGSALVIIERERPRELPSFRALVVRDAGAPQALGWDRVSARLAPLPAEPFVDLDPGHAQDVNTPGGNQMERTRGTKLGGFPSPLQDRPHGGRCSGCKLSREFVAQLSMDVFGDDAFGDCGRLYAFLCPRCLGTKLVTQSA